MALTATAQSALPPNPSWDEMIVPTLRKRLESESRAISKRMSASVSSGDEGAYVNVFQRGVAGSSSSSSGQTLSSSSRAGAGAGGRSRAATNASQGTTATVTTTAAAGNGGTGNGSGGLEKPSAIPRPSLNYSRPHLEHTASSSSRISEKVQAEPSKKQQQQQQQQQKGRPARSRTYSQPYNIVTEAHLSDAARSGNVRRMAVSSNNNGSSLPTPASSRSNSPALLSGPSPPDARAPKGAKGRTKTQQPHASGPSTSKATARTALLTPERSPHPTWQTKTSLYADPHYASSLSSISVTSTSKAGQNMTEIMYEMPPFSANSHTSSIQDDSHDADDLPRPSAEEDRPFEHWYRGDLSRNGGVGELRVGNRMEMLEIANYGHRLREKRLADAALDARASVFQGRKRSESIGPRGSVYYDTEEGHMVMDETPLTDMEADTEPESDHEVSIENWDDQEDTLGESKLSTSTERQGTPTPTYARQLSESQIPRPTVRATSESPQSSSVTASRQQHFAVPVPQSQSLTLSTTANKLNANQKRARTKSPVPSSSASPNAKKPKVSAVQQKRSKSNIRTNGPDRFSAEYPVPPDGPGGMADAIPSWTRPVPKGNWDEVVLPVVARKMGLDDQYEEATGAPEPRPTTQEIAPAPGTFGYDPTKRRDRYQNTGGALDELPMDEFGQYPVPPPSMPSGEEEDKPIVTEQQRTSLRPRPSMRPRPPSPPPFSDYMSSAVDGARTATHVQESLSSKHVQQMQVEEMEEGAGCCKCVIM